MDRAGTTTKRRRVLPPPAAPPSPPPGRPHPPADRRRSTSRALVRARPVAAAGACALCLGLAMSRRSGGLAGASDGVQDASAVVVGVGRDGPARRRRRRLPARFPRYGDPAFMQACPWAVDGDETGVGIDAPRPANASILHANPISLVPWVRKSEGFSAWVCAVAQAYIYSRLLARQGQTSRLLLLFEGMNITQAVRPPNAKKNDTAWVVAPPKVNRAIKWCQSRPFCTSFQELEMIDEMKPWDKELRRGVVPLYRHAYKDSMKMRRIHEGEYDELSQTLAGFSVENGLGCALAAMWDLSPRLAEHEPRLFTELLPVLRDDDALVLSLYLRTQWADFRTMDPVKNAWDENSDRDVWVQKADKFLSPFVDCARQLEREYFAKYSGAGDDTAYSKIVWMVSSDSPLLKQHVRETFQQVVSLALDGLGTNDAATFSVSRKVVFTNSDGSHTRLNADPSHADVAKAFVDWYLLGESDTVIVDGKTQFTFGSTAALRTARPIYRGGACTRKVLVHPKK